MVIGLPYTREMEWRLKHLEGRGEGMLARKGKNGDDEVFIHWLQVD